MKREYTSFLVLLLMIFSLNQVGFAQASAPAKETAKSVVVNINSAGQGELERLPGIGPSLAKKILDFRQKNGQFKTPNDLMAVPGIGEKKFEQLKSMITVK
jgi:competence protein ComEA